MSRSTLIRPLACAALLLAARAPLAAQDVVEAGRAQGIAPPARMLEQLREDPNAFEFRRAWRQKTERVRVQRTALERRQGPRLSVAALVDAEAAVTGTLRVPVLMGMYAGATAPYATAEYQARLFGPQLYSARSFYAEMSRGVFTLDGTVTPWLTLPQNAAYYQPVPGGDQYGRAADFLRHTLQAADAGTNFAQFDNDGPDGVPNSGDDDGYVDAAAFLYPAEDMSCGGPGIWPHRWVYSAWWGQPFVTGDAAAGGGFIRVDDYLIQGGIDCDGASLMQVGTFSHEMGHALGLPDLYDTYSQDGTSQGVGEWDLMGSGNHRRQDAPAHMGAWSKDFLGWLNVETVSASRTAFALPQVYTGGTVLRYNLPGTPEYFLMEHRAAVLSDRNLHGPGLLVFHVDPVVIDSTRNSNRVNGHPRRGVAVEEADGLDDLLVGRDRGDAGDVFPGSTGRTSFGDTGTPSTRSNGGTPSGLELRNITLAGGQLRFDIAVTRVSGPLVLGDSVAGIISAVGRRDTVSVQLTAGDVVDFGLFDTGAPPFSPNMTLYSPNGSVQGLPTVQTGGFLGVRRGRISPRRTIPTTGMYRVVIGSTAGTGGYVLKVRRAGTVMGTDPGVRIHVPVALNGTTGSDTVWLYNAGTGPITFASTAAGATWLTVANGAGQLSPAGTSAPALAPADGVAGPGAAAYSAPLQRPGAPLAAGLAGTEPQQAPNIPGAYPVVLTVTRGDRAQGDHVAYLVTSTGDEWTGPSIVEVRMRVYEREVAFVTPQKMHSRPVALAVAPEGDLAVVLVNGEVLRMDPRTGAFRRWATTSTSVYWGMAFGPDSSAYIAEWRRVARVSKEGVVTQVLTTPGVVYDVVVTPAGDLFAAADDGLWRRTRAGVTSRLTSEVTFGVAYNPEDGLIYASPSASFIRRVDPVTGEMVGTVNPDDASLQQQLEVGAGGNLYGRTYYVDWPDVHRVTQDGVVDRVYWTPQPFPQAMSLAPDGTLYGTAGDRVFRLPVEGVAAPSHVAGDVTGDGAVTAQDALGVLSAIVGRTLPEGWTAAWGDANCDDQVTAQDALIILSHSVGRDVSQFCVMQPRP
ncbi:MAG TPA: M6 family metalloprotease domain-containing protein [Longimicrobium sp.]|nr:M6 family metalloprotease domain-containing protein [Longimicrobium sp.]